MLTAVLLFFPKGNSVQSLSISCVLWGQKMSLWEEEEKNPSEYLTSLSDGARGLPMNNTWGLREDEEQTFWHCWTKASKGKVNMPALLGERFYWLGQWSFSPPLQGFLIVHRPVRHYCTPNALALTSSLRLMVFTAWLVALKKWITGVEGSLLFASVDSFKPLLYVRCYTKIHLKVTCTAPRPQI